MKSHVTAVAASAIPAATIVFLVTGCGSSPSRSSATPPRPSAAPSSSSTIPSTRAMSVAILSVKPTTVTAKHPTVTFHLRVTGITLDATHMGGCVADAYAPPGGCLPRPPTNIRGHGHIQIYANSIPNDAYVRKDLEQHWLASLAAPTIGLNLLPAIVGGRGKHRIIVALAQNNYVLYRVRTASVTITVK